MGQGPAPGYRDCEVGRGLLPPQDWPGPLWKYPSQKVVIKDPGECARPRPGIYRPVSTKPCGFRPPPPTIISDPPDPRPSGRWSPPPTAGGCGAAWTTPSTSTHPPISSRGPSAHLPPPNGPFTSFSRTDWTGGEGISSQSVGQNPPRGIKGHNDQRHNRWLRCHNSVHTKFNICFRQMMWFL